VHIGALLKLMPRSASRSRSRCSKAGPGAVPAKFGHTTAQDGRTSPGDLNMRRARRQGVLKLDVVAYPDLQMTVSDPALKGPLHARTYTNGFRIGGVKLNLDGSPQGKTAWLSQPFFKPPPGQPPTYAGYPTYKDDAGGRGRGCCARSATTGR
jgi:predicted amidohydrolase YtcJ